ncbi:MAG: divergent polysaccharide deacetylase family protein [Pseudomonadota bacterium]
MSQPGFSRSRGRRVGNAGAIAAVMIAVAGAGVGALAAYMSNFGARADAAKSRPPVSESRYFAPSHSAQPERAQIVGRMLRGEPPARLAAPESKIAATRKPQIIIVMDDMGVDPAASLSALALPGPMTMSFLPYGGDVQTLVSRAQSKGHEVMLHLPMQPRGQEDPGPHALTLGLTGSEFLRRLEWNLEQFEGYVGVNNHMGSRLTADEAAMKTVLAYLNERDLFFLDSVTTGDTVVQEAGAMVGANVFSRDVFLDPTPGDRQEVRRQLMLVERIALETGYAVAIAHPRRETLEVLGPWLTSVKARGFELKPASSLLAPAQPQVLASAPELRL